MKNLLQLERPRSFLGWRFISTFCSSIFFILLACDFTSQQQWFYLIPGTQQQQQPQQFHFAYSPEFQQFRLQPFQQVNNDIPSFQHSTVLPFQPQQQQGFQPPQQSFIPQQQHLAFDNGPTFVQQFPTQRQETSTVLNNNNNFQQQKHENFHTNIQQFPQGAQFNHHQHFVHTSVPGEFQEQLPELVKPPIMMAGDSNEQRHLFRDHQQGAMGQHQLLPPPLAPPQWALQSQQQQRPRIVHIQPVQIAQKEFFNQLPHELVGEHQSIGVKLEKQSPTPPKAVSPRTKTPHPIQTTTRRIPKQRLTTTHKPMKAGETNKKDNIPTALEFDLPPPPPSRFLPESEKIRISELIRQNQLLKNVLQNEEEKNFTPLTTFPTLVSSKKSALVTKAPKRVSTLPPLQTSSHLRDPNKVFLDCCKRKRVAKSCESRCNFDVLNKKILSLFVFNSFNFAFLASMFLGSDKCPTEYGLDLFTCAAQDSDHSSCCRSKRVHATAAGDKCLAFCNLAPDAPKIQLDATYLPCWAVLNEVKSCFREGIIKTP